MDDDVVYWQWGGNVTHGERTWPTMIDDFVMELVAAKWMRCEAAKYRRASREVVVLKTKSGRTIKPHSFSLQCSPTLLRCHCPPASAVAESLPANLFAICAHIILTYTYIRFALLSNNNTIQTRSNYVSSIYMKLIWCMTVVAHAYYLRLFANYFLILYFIHIDTNIFKSY